MAKTELRAYLVEHPNDQNTFQAFVGRYTSEASSPTYPVVQSPEEIQEVDNLIQPKLTQPKSS
ncbi:MAG: DUF6887 family protein [Waterburya sp.]